MSDTEEMVLVPKRVVEEASGMATLMRMAAIYRGDLKTARGCERLFVDLHDATSRATATKRHPDLESMVKELLPIAKGAMWGGVPLPEMTRDELMATIADAAMRAPIWTSTVQIRNDRKDTP